MDSKQANIWGGYSASARSVALQVLLHGPLARKELAERTGLSAGSLSRLTKPLIEDGVLRESDDQPRSITGGRPRQPLEVNADFETFAGIKLTADRAYVVITNLRSEPLHSVSIALASNQPDDVARELAARLGNIEPASGIHAVGVCLGGAVIDHRLVRYAPFLSWEDVNLARSLERVLHIPCHVSNDLEALTCFERWFGPSRSFKNFTIITTGAGVGIGTVINGELVTSPDAGLGLIGHQPLNPSGPRCADGHCGCASAYLDIPNIEKRASRLLDRPTTYNQLIDLAAAGDPKCHDLVEETARAMGTLAAMVANTCLPEHILITGEGWRLMDMMQRTIHETVTYSRPPKAAPVPITIRADDPANWAAGAAALAIQQSIAIG